MLAWNQKPAITLVVLISSPTLHYYTISQEYKATHIHF
uniref:Uncharacterized protein n=1 Tax=Arundo donax TaxID=35708 RepID=A0A0A9EIU9_ARUDO